MTGLVAALIAAISFAASTVFIRKGVYKTGESFSSIPISVFLGMVFFTIVLLVTGRAGGITSLSWLGIGSLAGAGIIHFVLGRALAYYSIRIIGTNRAVPIAASNMLVATVLGILLLREPLTIPIVLAILLIMGGVVIISTTGFSNTGKEKIPRGLFLKGIYAALGAAICWGVSPILIKVGLREADSFLAIFVSHLAASVVVAGLLLQPANAGKMRRVSRTPFILLTAAAAATALAQMLMYMALDFSPAGVVASLIATNTLLIFPLSFLINRRIEAFDPKTIGGAIAVVGGVFLMFWIT